MTQCHRQTTGDGTRVVKPGRIGQSVLVPRDTRAGVGGDIPRAQVFTRHPDTVVVGISDKEGRGIAGAESFEKGYFCRGVESCRERGTIGKAALSYSDRSAAGKGAHLLLCIYLPDSMIISISNIYVSGIVNGQARGCIKAGIGSLGIHPCTYGSNTYGSASASIGRNIS